jgi:endo-1,3-1,4-beta-glycanase ExoK
MKKLLMSCVSAILLFNFMAVAKDYNGAELYSTKTVKYGRFDVRMRAISGSGTVSSFFVYYNDSYLGSPEPWQEIDIEVLGKTNNVFQSNIITGNAAQKTTSEKLHTFENLSKAYHTYSVEWTPDYMAWFFDGVEVRRSTGKQVTDCQVKEMSYRFNLWISSEPAWVGSFDPSILPVYQYVNWMKYSKYTPGSGVNGTNFTPDWEDNFDTFNTSRWAKGDWTFDGNLVDFSPNNIVVKNGYCVICLTKANQTGFSGEVPVDQGTSIGNSKKEMSMKIYPAKSNDLSKYYLLSLDGRLLSQKSTFSNNLNSGMWISNLNSTSAQKIIINK